MGDEAKRKTYDSLGMTSDEQAQAGAGGGFGGDPFGFSGFWGGQGAKGGRAGGFEDIFENFGDFFNMGMGGAGQQKGQDVLLSISISFQDAFRGALKEVAFDKVDVCNRCNGTKAEPGSQSTKCGTCAGKGTLNYRQGPMTFQMTCSKCQGKGTIVKNPCKTCNATGVAKVVRKETINIPKGINNGQSLRIGGKVLNQILFSVRFNICVG